MLSDFCFSPQVSSMVVTRLKQTQIQTQNQEIYPGAPHGRQELNYWAITIVSKDKH